MMTILRLTVLTMFCFQVIRCVCLVMSCTFHRINGLVKYGVLFAGHWNVFVKQIIEINIYKMLHV